RKSLDEDRTKTFVVEISPLGLVEMTRQNVTDGVREIMSRTCPVCHGEGVIKSEETIAIGIARHLRHMVAEQGDAAPEAFLLRMNARVSAWFTADGARELHALEEQTGRYFHFEGSEGLPLDHFAVVQTGTREEIEERAVPFRVGEEVHVDIVEPHMYNPDDGVAKIDGYLITVTGGIGFVGDKKLVRIEQAGRTTAVASLTGADADAAEAASVERAEERRKADDRARRSAAAKRGAAARKVREQAVADAEAPAEDGAKPRSRRRRRAKTAEAVEADATQVLADDDEGPTAGTAPAAVEESEVVAEAASGDGDALSSSPRRRGRRGGRRRSRAKASDASE
ncbi:MAG TPA: TRAM domain-containing protein, partial [Solirubrobacteraceae bacterium]|nr:TRAM domain-containing protein [Solirubrobacteraceae bacterium]